MTHHLLGSLIIIAATAVGCSKDKGAGEAVSTSAGEDVDRAVTVYRAVQANPNAADSVLAAHQLTAEGFDSLMYQIAADSAKAAAYAAAVQ